MQRAAICGRAVSLEKLYYANEMLTDEQIIAKLCPSEDNFVERKSSSDKRDWLKTVVAFANTCPIGFPGVLLIGVRNDGTIEERVNFDSLQITLNEILNDAYPPIFRLPKVIEHDAHPFLAVLIPGSESRPHFSGPAFVRIGSETIRASDEQFEKIIADRSSKVRAVREFLGKPVTVENRRVEHLHMGDVAGTYQGRVSDYTKHFVVIESGYAPYQYNCYPFERLLLSRDLDRKQLRLEVYPVPVSHL